MCVLLKRNVHVVFYLISVHGVSKSLFLVLTDSFIFSKTGAAPDGYTSTAWRAWSRTLSSAFLKQSWNEESIEDDNSTVRALLFEDVNI